MVMVKRLGKIRKGAAMTKKKKPITNEQISEVKCRLSDVSDQVAFLQQVFSDIPPILKEDHFYGLRKILEHIHADSYKAWDLLDELDTQLR